MFNTKAFQRASAAPGKLPPATAASAAFSAEQVPEEFSFEKYLKRPEVSGRSGMTSRVAKILDGVPLALGAGNVVGAWKPSEKELNEWIDEKAKLASEIEKLNAEIGKLRKSARAEKCMASVNAAQRPAASLSELTEVELLRLENFELRNMTDEQRHSKAREIIIGLKQQIETLQEENSTLHARLAEKNSKSLADSFSKPPSDIFTSARPIPLSMDRLDEQRICSALETEWKLAREESRHGSGAPIQNPFQKRRP